MLIANFILLFVAYAVILIYFRKVSDELNKLDVKQQSTIFGVSHVWGSVKELKEYIETFQDEISRMIEIENELRDEEDGNE
tara:strand:- start:1334 stop:1576 length:243 start_codon:yes stop_codon:yes gene_type:complete